MGKNGQHERDEQYGYGFHVRMNGSVSAPHPSVGPAFAHRRAEIVALRDAIKKSNPEACGCAHEQLIAQTYTTRGKFREAFSEDPARVALPLLCPPDARENNPLCAHATSMLRPDPFGPQLRALLDMGLLSEPSLLIETDDIAGELIRIDEDAARNRWAGREWIEKKLAAMGKDVQFRDDEHRRQWTENAKAHLAKRAQEEDDKVVRQAKAAQEPLRQKLLVLQKGLVHMLDMVIAEIDKSGDL